MKQTKKTAIALAITQLVSIASATAHAQIAEATAPGEQTAPVQAVVVTGVRASQLKAIDIKRNEDKVVDAIVAEDIGKLPDFTIADSLQRVTGVQVAREAGEAGRVTLRGMPQVLTTLNGDMFLGAGNVVSTQPNYADIPASLIAGASVIKSNTADILPGGIAGTIDLKTRQPMDLNKGWNLTGITEAQRGSLSKKTSPNVSVLAGYKAHDSSWAALVSANKSRSERANYNANAQNNDWDRITPDGVLKNPNDASAGYYDLTGKGAGCVTAPFPAGINPGAPFGSLTPAQTNAVKSFHDRNNLNCLLAGNYVWMPRMISANDRKLIRDREAVSAAFTYKLSREWRATLESFHSKIADQNYRHDIYFHNNGVLFDRLQPGIEMPTISENNVVTKGVQRTARLFSRAGNERADGKATNTMLRLEYGGQGPLSGDLRFQYSNNRRDLVNGSVDSNLDPTATSGPAGCTNNCTVQTGTGTATWPGYLMDFDLTGKEPAIGFRDGGWDATKLRLGSFSVAGSEEVGRLGNFATNGVWDDKVWLFDGFKFGARVSRQNIDRFGWQMYAPTYTGTPGQNYNAYPSISSVPVGTPFRDALKPGVAPDLLSAHPDHFTKVYNQVGVIATPPIALVDPAVLKNPLAQWQSQFTTWTDPATNQTYTPVRAASPEQNYRFKLVSKEAYFQADFSGDAWFGWTYAGNVGLRRVDSEATITRHLVDVNTRQFVNGPLADLGTEVLVRRYSDNLPSFNLRVAPAPNLAIRLGVNKAITRPDISVLGKQTTYGRNANNGTDPSLPDAFNIFLNANAGNADLQPWRSTNTNLSLEWYPTREILVNLAAYRLDIDSFARTITFNAPGPDIDGEVRRTGTWTQTVNGEGTYTQGLEGGVKMPFTFLPGAWSGLGIDANYTYGESKGFDTDFAGDSLPLPDFSEHTANLAIWYQKYGWQARIAANWRSPRFSSVRGQRNPNTNLSPADPALVNQFLGNSSLSNARLATWYNAVTYVDASVSYDIGQHATVYLQATNLLKAYDSRYAQFEEMFMDQSAFDRTITIGARFKF
ncbi:TonB-dependent receptor [Pseudoduganella lutea]|uniref:TonB-dependent receptor n=1 Tax=Pseudoduganella lutea TaxID=321985 RepID=A0A4P6L4Y7_9BURK|nr:TonB-dependent receptor [Pseudoduganella lutea]QBE66405.1 TonB-dependent receptor [Pseudoduganella lutea]